MRRYDGRGDPSRRLVPSPRRAGLALAGGLVLLVPAIALAHPLGNFTVNHYAGIRVEPDRIVLDLVIDEAEIPTFQDRLTDRHRRRRGDLRRRGRTSSAWPPARASSPTWP